MQLEQFIFNSFQTRCCVVWDADKRCTITDPGCSSEKELEQLTGFIAEKALKPVCILLTHGHFDHILGVSKLAGKYGIPVYMHPEERFTLENNTYFSTLFGIPVPEEFVSSDVADGDIIEVGAMKFEVISTPGHTRGGVCYYERENKILICGDTIFAGAIGRTDVPGGDYDTLMKSIFEKVMTLDSDVTIFPGHGPESDLATEGMTNPFLMPFNEPLDF